MSAVSANETRRRAAWAVFESHLESEQRIDAIRVLEKSYQKSDMNTIIGYVSNVGEKYGLSDATCKKLYYEYYSLLKTPDDLPEDPLPMMDKAVREAAGLATTTQFTAPANPFVTQMQARGVKLEARRRESPEVRQAHTHPKAAVDAAPAPTPAPTRKKKQPAKDPKLVIFNFLIHKMVEYSPESLDTLFVTMIGKVGDQNLPGEASTQFGHWMSSPMDHRWRSMSGDSMSAIVQLVFVSLCELIGKEDAEALLKKVVSEANSLIEAKSFSPQNFM